MSSKWVKWSVEDENKLIEIYPYKTNKELACIFNRSVVSIQHKATNLKLNKDENFLSKIKSERQLNDKNHMWRGGRKINAKGHVLILKRNHPLADANGYVLEHRYIMYEHMGRKLNDDEVIHHINENKTDNRLENLQVMTRKEHTILHHKNKKRNIQTRIKISKALKERNNK